jgi:hypothetical protein
VKKLLKGLYISLVAALVVVILLLISLCVYSFDCKDIPKSLEMLATTFTAITSSLSVIIAAINIAVIRKQFKESKKTEVFAHWYKDLIIDRHLHEIKGFFDKCEELINGVDFEEKHKTLNGDEYDSLIAEQIFEPFTSDYTKLHRNLVSDLKIIDEGLSDSVSKMFSDYQDEFTEHFNQKYINIEKIQLTVKKYYGSVIGSLMKYDMSYNS